LFYILLTFAAADFSVLFSRGQYRTDWTYFQDRQHPQHNFNNDSFEDQQNKLHAFWTLKVNFHQNGFIYTTAAQKTVNIAWVHVSSRNGVILFSNRHPLNPTSAKFIGLGTESDELTSYP